MKKFLLILLVVIFSSCAALKTQKSNKTKWVVSSFYPVDVTDRNNFQYFVVLRSSEDGSFRKIKVSLLTCQLPTHSGADGAGLQYT